MERMLIVDDEIEILEWLEELFLYEYPREVEVHAVSSAYEALEILDQMAFHVILTDIKMPGMNGRDFYEKVKANWPECRVVFLTGYREFEDIYRVINDKNVRYILKSEEDEVILQAVEDAFGEIKAEIEKQKNLEKQKGQIEKAQYWMKCEKIHQIVERPECLSENLESLRELGSRFAFSEKMLLFLLRLDTRWEYDPDDESFLEQCGDILKKRIPEWIRMEEVLLEHRFLLLFFQPTERDNHQWHRIFQVSKGAVENVQEIYAQEKSFSGVVSSQTLCLEKVKEHILRMRRIMAGYMGGMRSAILDAEKTETVYETQVFETDEKVNEECLKLYLELHQRTSFFQLLHRFCEQIGKGRSRHDMRAMELYFKVSSVLLQFINEHHLQEILAFRIGLYKLLSVDEHRNWEEAGTYLMNLSEEIFDALGQYENTLSDRALDRVVEYIDTHLEGDLSLTNLAAIGGFNASYLSRLFKKVQNETISDYVLKKRMEAAKVLLQESQEKIQSISTKTGYLSSTSFSRAFRGYMGVSPQEYREMGKQK